MNVHETRATGLAPGVAMEFQPFEGQRGPRRQERQVRRHGFRGERDHRPSAGAGAQRERLAVQVNWLKDERPIGADFDAAARVTNEQVLLNTVGLCFRKLTVEEHLLALDIHRRAWNSHHVPCR